MRYMYLTSQVQVQVLRSQVQKTLCRVQLTEVVLQHGKCQRRLSALRNITTLTENLILLSELRNLLGTNVSTS